MHNKVRYLKFVLNEDNGLFVEYDLPVKTSDDCVGKAALEMMICIAKTLNDNYSSFMKALYA